MKRLKSRARKVTPTEFVIKGSPKGHAVTFRRRPGGGLKIRIEDDCGFFEEIKLGRRKAAPLVGWLHATQGLDLDG